MNIVALWSLGTPARICITFADPNPCPQHYVLLAHAKNVGDFFEGRDQFAGEFSLQFTLRSLETRLTR